MSARANGVKLGRATKQFLQSWERVKVHWRDRKAADFEKDYIQGLPEEINKAAKVIEEIDKILTRARRDCEE